MTTAYHRPATFERSGFDQFVNYQPRVICNDTKAVYGHQRYQDIETCDQYGFQPSRQRVPEQGSSASLMRAEA